MLDTSHCISFVATSRPEASREFYEKTLGLRFVSGDQFALVFELPGAMLRVQKVDKVHPHAYTALGWRVTDIRAIARGLAVRGVAFARYEGLVQDELGIWTSPGGAQIAWFPDPDGNILSLTQFSSPPYLERS